MRRLVTLLVCLLLVMSLVPASVAAADRVGTTVVVEENEQVDSFSTTAGTVIVRGTVDGNLDAYAGTVVIEDGGEVTGQLRTVGGSTTIAGDIGSSTVTYGGSLTVEEGATLGGSLGFVGGSATIAGAVDGDGTVIAGSLTLEETAQITGTLNYAGSLTDRGGTVDGGQYDSADSRLVPTPPGVVGPAVGLYALLANAALGVLLLALLPGFSRAVEVEVFEQPAYTLGIGIGALAGMGVVVLLAALTIVGIPIALAALAMFAIVCWIGSVYGRYVLGRLLLSRTSVTNRYGALAVGLLFAAIVGLIPYVGDLLNVLLILGGLGASVVVTHRLHQRVREGRQPWR